MGGEYSAGYRIAALYNLIYRPGRLHSIDKQHRAQLPSGALLNHMTAAAGDITDLAQTKLFINYIANHEIEHMVRNETRKHRIEEPFRMSLSIPKYDPVHHPFSPS